VSEQAPLGAEVLTSLKSVVAASADELTAIFQDLHRHPELGFAEMRTAGILAAELERLGFAVTTGIAGTGVVGILRNGDGPTVMYRADMDANAVEEATGLPYASTVRVTRDDGADVPVAHLCGHDAHVTWMIGLARVLVELRQRWTGTVVLVGQPAEEPITGARAMVDAGLYTTYAVPKPDFYLGIHTAPVPVGTALSPSGTLMAGTDQIDVVIRGIGGHGSMPQMAKDPVVMAALAVVQLQTVVSRMIAPREPAVLTVGSIQAGADNNVIPASALLKVNTRWYDVAVRDQLIAGIRAVCDGIARTYGVPDDLMPEYTFKGGSTPLVNDDALSARLAEALGGLLGADNVITSFPAATGSEDVHLLISPFDDVPFSYLIVGVADPQLCAEANARGEVFPYANHNPNFVVDLRAIPIGAEVAAVAVLDLLGRA